tara:strand:- start:1426 stop:2082 length:657 start_codon:yes stop_codon:yes gene_type:complete
MSTPITKKTAEKSWWNKAGHLGLDVLGLVPLVGNIADGANAAWYGAEGDYANAALSAAAAIPGAGYAAFGAKMVGKGLKAAKPAVKIGKLSKKQQLINKGKKALKNPDFYTQNAKFFRSSDSYPDMEGPKEKFNPSMLIVNPDKGETAQETYNKLNKNPGSTRIPQGGSAWTKAVKRNQSGISLSELVKRRNSAEKGSAEYAAAQNAINAAYNVKKRY